MTSIAINLFQDNRVGGYTSSSDTIRNYMSYYDYYDLASIGIGNTFSPYFIESNGAIINNYRLLRKSIKDNFVSTEDMSFLINNFSVFISLPSEYLDNRGFVSDPFIESGIYYTYKWTDDDAWIYNSSTDPGTGSCFLNNNTGVTYTGIIPNYDGSFLMGINGTSFTQIKITYGESIGSFEEIVKDSIIETIGSTYPYVIRQANTQYKKISFSGTVVSDMNYGYSNRPDILGNYTFINPISDFYAKGTTDSNATALYNVFSSINNLSYGQNYVIEKTFRENLLSFLNNGKPKVLKTAAEGMFLVRLTDLSFTPKQELGRMIYDFSCTLTEIAPANAESIESYIFSS